MMPLKVHLANQPAGNMLCYDMLLMVQRNPPQAVWFHLVPSWCTIVSEVKRQGVQEIKNID